jgi:hypothetical protein
MTVVSEKKGWLVVSGHESAALEKELAELHEKRLNETELKAADVHYVSRLSCGFIDKSAFSISDDRLEKLRMLCRLWDVDIRAAQITSHRRFIGPVIVKAKKLFYPLLAALLKDVLHQQRLFNATAIELLAEVSAQKDTQPKKLE